LFSALDRSSMSSFVLWATWFASKELLSKILLFLSFHMFQIMYMTTPLKCRRLCLGIFAAVYWISVFSLFLFTFLFSMYCLLSPWQPVNILTQLEWEGSPPVSFPKKILCSDHPCSYEELSWHRWYMIRNWHNHTSCLEPFLHLD